MSQLIEELRKLPGIGAKSAQRLAFHILRSPAADAEALAVAVRELKAKLRLCSVCNNITDVDPCVYCASATRNQRLAAVSSIRKIDLLSLSRQEARIEVKYVGTQDQLKSSLAEVNLDLGGGDPIWRIQSSGAASAR